MPDNTSSNLPFSLPSPGCIPVGYAHLVEKYRLEVVFHAVWTFVHGRSAAREVEREGSTLRLWPMARHPGDRDVDHLLFALRFEGPSLGVCRALFAHPEAPGLAGEITAEVRSRPTSAFRRQAWFLWEALTGERLALPDLDRGNYVPLLDPLSFVTGPVRKQRRQRIDLNLLGLLDLAPTIRRTPKIDEALARPISEDLHRRVEAILERYDEAVVRRALSFLYSRETRASFEIENEQPSRSREDRFIALLRRASGIEALDLGTLVQLQNETVDPRFASSGWRSTQVYVGEALDSIRQSVHYVGPRPEDVSSLMDTFFQLTELLVEDPELDGVLVAAAVSFLFVLIHPFDDGNGRLHRWLICWILARRGVTPPEVVIPVSAVIQSRRHEYDEALETFSRPLMRRLSFDLDALGRMTVEGATADFYRYPDLTRMAEALIAWLDLAIREEFVAELELLVGFDGAQQALREIVDMPDRLIALFIKLCHQGGGTLSERKRKQHFGQLTSDEIRRMEEAVAEHLPAPLVAGGA